jgi:hypothetical protein
MGYKKLLSADKKKNPLRSSIRFLGLQPGKTREEYEIKNCGSKAKKISFMRRSFNRDSWHPPEDRKPELNKIRICFCNKRLTFKEWEIK